MSEKPPVSPSTEQTESQEGNHVSKEQVLNAYASTTRGKEDGPAKELLIKWIDQHYAELETISDQFEHSHALIAFEYEKAELYFETGYDDVALEELEGDGMQEGLLYMARHRGEDELEESILGLIDRIKDRIIQTGETLADSDIDAPDLDRLTAEELKKEQARADADEAFELSNQIKVMLSKKEG